MNKSENGFSLIEVMIAMTIFAVFIATYVTSQGSNLADSTLLREEIFLKQLAEERINEIVANPPDLKDSLTLSKDTKVFEKFSNYEHTTRWKKIKLPDVGKLQAQSEEEEEGNENNGEEGGAGDLTQASGVEKTLMKKVKENMEKLIWQVEVTVRNKETQFSFTAATWLLNEDTKIKIDGY